MATLREKTESIKAEVDPKVAKGRAKKAEIQNIIGEYGLLYRSLAAGKCSHEILSD